MAKKCGLFVGPPDAPDKYALVRQVGGGSEAVLWLGHLNLDGVAESVVVKELRAEQRSDLAHYRTRWAEQAELLRFIRHPGVVAVREHFTSGPMHRAGELEGASDGHLYLVMNWVDGQSLRDWVAHAQNTDTVQTLACLEQIATTLDLLHSGRATPSGRGLVHGDLSPGNVMITSDGQAVLVDFGLVRISPRVTRNSAGTPGYTAPEVWSSGSYSPNADRYSFGALSFYALTGQHPPSTPTELRAGLASLPLLTGASDAALEHVMTIFSAEPDQRPSATNWLRALRDSAPTGSGSLGHSGTGNNTGLPVPSSARSAAATWVPHVADQPTLSTVPEASARNPGLGAPVTQSPQPPIPSVRLRPRLIYAGVAVGVAALLVALAVTVAPRWNNNPDPKNLAQGQGEIFEEPADSPGPNPFTPNVTVPPTPNVAPINAAASPSTPSIRGTDSAVYGAVRNDPGYNKTQLASYLTADPTKSAAWCHAMNCQSGSSIPDFFNNLTPVTLRSPIRATLWIYINGQARPIQVYMQAGTQLLVDPRGMPVVRLASGSPLGAPIPTVGRPIIKGTGWPGVNLGNAWVIAPGLSAVTVFALYDLTTGQLFYRPVGTFGPVDYLPAAPAPPPVLAPAPLIRRAAPHRVAPRPTIRHPQTEVDTDQPRPPHRTHTDGEGDGGDTGGSSETGRQGDQEQADPAPAANSDSSSLPPLHCQQVTRHKIHGDGNETYTSCHR
jgi:serine/threonine protein kinase